MVLSFALSDELRVYISCILNPRSKSFICFAYWQVHHLTDDGVGSYIHEDGMHQYNDLSIIIKKKIKKISIYNNI